MQANPSDTLATGANSIELPPVADAEIEQAADDSALDNAEEAEFSTDDWTQETMKLKCGDHICYHKNCRTNTACQNLTKAYLILQRKPEVSITFISYQINYLTDNHKGLRSAQ